MTRRMVQVVILLWIGLFFGAKGYGAEGLPAEKRNGGPAQQKENPCDCCQKCVAAMKSIEPKPEEQPAAKDGCEECCARCGSDKKPTPERFPPEILPR